MTRAVAFFFVDSGVRSAQRMPSIAPVGLPRDREVVIPATTRPRLVVIVDTEEEFNWGAPFSRARTSVRAMRYIGRAHTVFEKYRIRPTYVIDYPVVAQPEGAAALQDLFRSGACAIGAHLHPWVNPPYTEELNPANSFMCNLRSDLQAVKLRILTDTIADRFEWRPRVFKAGRYGLGAASVDLLVDLDFQVDVSVCPRMDFTAEGGPSFDTFDSQPFFLTPTLLECPCTVDYVGWMGKNGRIAHRLAGETKLVGALARLGAVNRVMLSPEGNTLGEMRELARALYRRGLRVFTLSYHSPSLEPGHTPYVQSAADLDRFLSSLDGFCDFFMSELRGCASTPEEVRDLVLSESLQ